MNANSKQSKQTRPAKPRAARKAPEPTTDAQRRAAVILEVLAGVRTAQEAASVLKICPNHYHLLERKALQGLVSACEPAPRRGRVTSEEQQIRKLQRELERSRRDCLRQAALVRATQRAVGVPVVEERASKSARKRGGKKTSGRRRRHPPRALRAARDLHQKLAADPTIAVESTATVGDGQSLPSAQELSHGTSRAQTAEAETHLEPQRLAEGQAADDHTAEDTARRLHGPRGV